jgi:hypothetical protein
MSAYGTKQTFKNIAIPQHLFQIIRYIGNNLYIYISMENKPVKRPITIYVILLVLTSIGIYFTISSFLVHLNDSKQSDGLHFFGYIIAFIFLFTSISLYLNKRWSRVLIYLFSIIYSICWSALVLVGIQKIMKDGINIQEQYIYIILGILGFLLLVACIVSNFIVTKYLNRI